MSSGEITRRENGNINKITYPNGDVEYYFNDENNRKALFVGNDGKCFLYFNNTQNLPYVEFNEKKGVFYHAQILRYKTKHIATTTAGFYMSSPHNIREALELENSSAHDYFRHSDDLEYLLEKLDFSVGNEAAGYKQYYADAKHTLKEKYTKDGMKKYDIYGKVISDKEQYLMELPPKGQITSVDEALKYEDSYALNKLIKEGYDINSCDKKGNTLLGRYYNKLDNYYIEAEEVGCDSGAYYKHLNRAIDLLEKAGALEETEKSCEIKRQIKEKAEALAQKRELNNSKLAKVRNKAAKFADKITEVTGTEKFVQKFTDGKKIADVEISTKKKMFEKKISDKLFGKVNE